jgi:hypothetical protein
VASFLPMNPAPPVITMRMVGASKD